MMGKPSVFEYAQLLQEADNRVSDETFSCFHTNTGWVGYFLTYLPTGEKYCVVKKDLFKNTGYYLCEYTSCIGQYGRHVANDVFASLDDVKQYILKR